MLFQFHLNVRVTGISSSTFKLLDAVHGGEGGGQQLGEDQVDLGDQADGATGSSSGRLACEAGLLFRVWSEEEEEEGEHGGGDATCYILCSASQDF